MKTTEHSRTLAGASGSPSESTVLKFCNDVRECDDNLGRVSDHEGSHEGPTYAAWSRGPDAFERHAEAVISWHKHAITVYRRGLKLNTRRRGANTTLSHAGNSERKQDGAATGVGSGNS